jgi:TonB-dependent receptor-like protein/carboxypeptidase family protein
MGTTSRMTASAVVGGLVLVCLPAVAIAQVAGQLRAITHVASIAAGSIQGTVLDERGAPVVGATVSAFGASTAFAVSDRTGRFEMRTLSPGPYVLRAHLTGFVASHGQVIEVRPSGRASSSIALRHVNAGPSSTPVLAAGLGTVPEAPNPLAAPDPDGAASTVGADNDDHGELAWRMRHARRTVLKDATVPEEMVGPDTPSDADGFGGQNVFERVTNSSAKLASNFFGSTPFSGQVNLLTSGSFDSPQQLFSSDNFAHNTAYLALGAPVGEHADWTVRAALTQGDISSWIVASEYTTRAPARHRYDIGMSYSTQRYEGGNFATLRDVTDGSRNAGAIYGFDTFSISPILTLTYGARYARYDYIDGGSLISPRVALTLEPADHFRVSTMLSSRAVAPGAEEFMPRADAGILLPPQRTFSSLVPGRPFEAERTNHVEVEVERDIASTTVSLRAFRQHVTDQIVTLFGVSTLEAPSAVGNYLLGNIGDVDASGVSAGIRTAFADHVHGAIEYTMTRARIASPDMGYMLVLDPSALPLDRQQIHDLATSIETEVPETSTRVVVLYRLSNAFAHAASQPSAPALDARFDVQVRQALPFMDFSNAKWEMLVAVRNFFRETAPDQSVYDELLVVHPPKRIVGGLTLKF